MLLPFPHEFDHAQNTVTWHWPGRAIYWLVVRVLKAFWISRSSNSGETNGGLCYVFSTAWLLLVAGS
jgi:hypothetical protein